MTLSRQWNGRPSVVAVVFLSWHFFRLPTFPMPNTVLGVGLSKRQNEHNLSIKKKSLKWLFTLDTIKTQKILAEFFNSK